MLRLLKYLNKKEWLAIAGCLALILGMVWLELEIPEFMKEITLLLQNGGGTGDILTQGAYMLLCALAAGGLAVVVKFFSTKVGTSLGARLRSNVYSIVQDMSLKEVNKFSVSSLITRTTNDVHQVQSFISMGLQPMLRAPIMAVWALCIILGKGWQWSVATGVAVGILIISFILLFIFVLPKTKVIQKQNDELNRVTRDNLMGVRVVRAYNAEGYEEAKFEKSNDKIMKTNLSINRALAFLSPLMTLIMSGLNLAIYWLGAYVINGSAMVQRPEVFGEMIVFSSYAMQIILAFVIFALIFIMYPRAEVAGKRISQVLNTKSSIVSGDQSFDDLATGEIEFKNVSFKYDESGKEYCLKNLSFKASRGDTVAIIGATGSGKTTLVNLISRLYDVTEGEILIDGKNIKDINLKSLHNKIGYVPQKAVLFAGDIASNLKFGEVQKKESLTVDKALEIAQAKDFVEKKEEGTSSSVSQAGVNFSGGQKQRISIARALYRNPEFLILDDSFSALDYKTDKKLRQSLKKEFANTTTFIVAQRIGTIKDADLILVLEDGEIVGKGNHETLLKTCKEYKEIALSQLSKEEL